MFVELTLLAAMVWTVPPITTQPATASAPADVRWADCPGAYTNYPPSKYDSLEQWKSHRQWLQEQVRFAAGVWPEPERTPLNAHIFGKIDGDGYTIEKVYFESYPGYYVVGNLYRPAKIHGKIPGVLCPLGHWVEGRLVQQEQGNLPAQCLTLARLGCTVLGYDMVGFNEGKRQIDHKKDMGMPPRDLWGFTALGLQAWNGVRAIDFLQSLPEVDNERIGVTGASGGGTQTFILSAVDDRVTVAAPVCMLSHTMQGDCVCECAPCLRMGTNNMEIGALMAPKPLLLVSATGDWTVETPKVEYPCIRGIYELYGAADQVANAHFDAPHNYNKQSREAMYRFFGKHLLNRPDADTLTEGQIPHYSDEELLVWNDQTVPPSLLKTDQLIEVFKSAATKRIEAMRPDAKEHLPELNQTVHGALQHWVMPPPEGFAYRFTKGPEYDRFDVQGRSCRVRYQGPIDSPSEAKAFVMVFDPAGVDARQPALPDDVLTAYVGPFTTQKVPTSVPACRQSFQFTGYNRVDAIEDVYDINTLSSIGLIGTPPARWGWLGSGRMGPVSLLARAMKSRKWVIQHQLRTVIDMNRFDIDSDDTYIKELYVPHIRRIGGLRAIAAVACNGPIWFHNVGDHFDEEWVKAVGRLYKVEVRVMRDKADDREITAWLSAAK